MKLEQRHWTQARSWQPVQANLGAKANLVTIFGETNALKSGLILKQISAAYPEAILLGCSTSGEIQGTQVFDDSVATTAIQFGKTPIQSAYVDIASEGESYAAGMKLAESFDHKNLTHVFVLSVGLGVNGSELVKGLSKGLPKNVSLTGGLAGDNDRFNETFVICNSRMSNRMVAAVGLYGSHIKVRSASLGGWDPFGPERVVTKSVGNVLYELDGKSALSLYKNYLGEHVKNLPGSALLFPLCLRNPGETGDGLVRTILAIDHEKESMTFAGDIPMGSSARFMKANFDRLVDGAIGAAVRSQVNESTSPELAFLISCVGRKLVLKQRIEEEVEGVRATLGKATALTGFYSYGEISPFTPNAKCELHNQTMTITTLSEKNDEAA